jgi:hypothetical protein
MSDSLGCAMRTDGAEKPSKSAAAVALIAVILLLSPEFVIATDAESGGGLCPRPVSRPIVGLELSASNGLGG